MTKEEFNSFKENFINMVNAKKEHYPFLRLGQITFNEMWEKYPDVCDEIIGSKLDPFYVDERIDSFWTFVENKIVS